MIGLVRGRVYYNLRNWYRLIAFLPGYDFNKDFMAAMMGLKETADTGDAKELSKFDKYAKELPKMLFRGSKLGAQFYRIDAWVDEFFKMFRKVHAEYRAKDLESMSVDALVASYRELEDRVLWSWKAPIINDFAAMIYYGVLRRLVTKWIEPDPKSSLQNDLLCGEGGIESTEPTKRMMALAIEAKGTVVAGILEMHPDDQCLAALERFARESPEVSAFLEKIRDLLARYGDRCMNELKLESATLAEEPKFLFSVIKNYMKQEKLDPQEMERREKEIRARAEAVVAKRLRTSPVRAATFRHVLENARKAVKNRENMRFSRTRIFGVARRLFRAIGRQLAAAGLLADALDIFYLEVEEILALAEGRSTCWDLKALVALRRGQFDRWRREDVDDRFATRGVYMVGHDYKNPAAAAAGGDPNVLRGVGACPGRIKHRVRVIRSPDDDLDLNKEILVAERTDPGWVPLYPSACALLIERGSILSHSAIVARELGLPCVVGVRDLMKRVKDGDVVEMDGGEGTVRLGVDPEGASPEKIGG
jgi:pyruvate,water dikinase